MRRYGLPPAWNPGVDPYAQLPVPWSGPVSNAPPATMTVYDGFNWVKGLALAAGAVGIWWYLIRTAPKR